MREMKDSGIAWIGDIPEDWKVTTIKREYSFQTGWTPDTKKDNYFKGKNIWVNISDLKEREVFESTRHISDEAVQMSSMDISPKGSLMYAFKLSVGTVAFCGCDLYTNEAIATFLSGKNSLKYLYYSAPIFIKQNANENIYGAKILNQQLIRNAKIVLPLIGEQYRIANYLDEKCAKIDAIIEKQKTIIKKLKEYKLSIITEAVTKGLNSDVEMKDSESVWFGEIPKDWNFKRLKYVFRIQKRIIGEEGHTVLSITQRGIVPKDFSNNEGQFADSYANYQLVRVGDFAMNHMDLLTGWVDISKYEGVTSPDYRVFVLDDIKNSCPKYYLYMMQMCYSTRIFYNMGQGVSGMGRWRLQADKFLNFRIPVPSFKEQERIADYLGHRCSAIDKTIDSRLSVIDSLQEYKKSLIYEVVTGKKEVS